MKKGTASEDLGHGHSIRRLKTKRSKPKLWRKIDNFVKDLLRTKLQSPFYVKNFWISNQIEPRVQIPNGLVLRSFCQVR